MSIVKVSGNASGTGTLTIAAPNTNSDYTLTLPTNTGTLLSTKSAGTVLQVVNATYSTITSNSTSTYADTGLTATITPSSASNKILVFVSQNGCRKQTNDTFLQVRLVRTATTIATFAGAAGYTGSAATNDIGSVSIEYLDSPATTSATTYKTQLASGSNNAQVNVQTASETSTITLMEIAV
jgi:hypothetical protein